MNAEEVPLTRDIAWASRAVPATLRDPADRLLIATATVLGLTRLTADRLLLDSPAAPTVPAR